MLDRFKQRLDEYVNNKTWYWFLPFWLFAVYLFIKLFDFELGETAPSFFILIAQSLNFFLHEMAHLITAFLPHVFVALAGSLAELLLGLVLIVTAFFVRSYFASVFCFLWFMLASFSVADYIADAQVQQLPLVSFGGSDPIHDWHFILTKLNLLQYDALISGIVRGTGIIAGIVGVLFSGWLIVQIAHAKTEAARKAAIEVAMKKIASKPPEERDQDTSFTSGLYPEVTKGPLAGPDSIPSNLTDTDSSLISKD